MSIKTFGAIGVIVVAVIVGIALLGGDDQEAGASEPDGAFVTEMAPHHESAIAMAEIAQERAEHPEVKQLADNIIESQSAEIKTLGQIHERLYGEPISEGSHGTLGLPADQMGMTMDMDMLETAEPFDRAFIDMMIPHHQGAIRMARIQLEEGSDQETKDLATAIIAAQSKEIEEMNAWREEWYGDPSPAAGVPPMDEDVSAAATDDSMEGMDH